MNDIRYTNSWAVLQCENLVASLHGQAFQRNGTTSSSTAGARKGT
jgi:hypothetical protein